MDPIRLPSAPERTPTPPRTQQRVVVAERHPASAPKRTPTPPQTQQRVVVAELHPVPASTSTPKPSPADEASSGDVSRQHSVATFFESIDSSGSDVTVFDQSVARGEDNDLKTCTDMKNTRARATAEGTDVAIADANWFYSCLCYSRWRSK